MIGIAGGPHKCSYLTKTLDVNADIDYKNADVGEQLAKAAPTGVSRRVLRQCRQRAARHRGSGDGTGGDLQGHFANPAS